MKQVKGTINSVELVGWLGGMPELRITPNGSRVCKFSIATKRIARRDDNGKPEYETDWTIVEIWGRLAERCSAALHKGSRVMVTGSLRTDTWQDRETGQSRWKTYVRAEDVLFLDSRNGNDSDNGDSDNGYSEDSVEDSEEVSF